MLETAWLSILCDGGSPANQRHLRPYGFLPDSRRAPGDVDMPLTRSFPNERTQRTPAAPQISALLRSFYRVSDGRTPGKVSLMRGYVVRKGDRWYAVVYEGLDPVTGKERRRWLPAGTTREEAEQLAARLAAELNGRNDETRSLTFGAYLTDQWLPGKKINLAQSTWDGYRRKIDRHIIPAIGRLRIRRLRAHQRGPTPGLHPNDASSSPIGPVGTCLDNFDDRIVT